MTDRFRQAGSVTEQESGTKPPWFLRAGYNRLKHNVDNGTNRSCIAKRKSLKFLTQIQCDPTHFHRLFDTEGRGCSQAMSTDYKSPSSVSRHFYSRKNRFGIAKIKRESKNAPSSSLGMHLRVSAMQSDQPIRLREPKYILNSPFVFRKVYLQEFNGFHLLHNRLNTSWRVFQHQTPSNHHMSHILT